jgi:uncharacterized protein (DUF1697 family)
MTVWIALLRAVNLGARNKVPMASLREHLAAAGLKDVRTHLQSGNVIVRSPDEVGPIIRAVVRDEFGVDEPVMVRSRDRLAEIVAANPFAAEAIQRLVMVRDRFHGNSLSAAMVARRLGRHGTERNWATITKLLELADQEP